MLATVYEVPNEDRFGTWLVDSQRFQQRINSVKEIIDPILDSNHRQKIRRIIGS